MCAGECQVLDARLCGHFMGDEQNKQKKPKKKQKKTKKTESVSPRPQLDVRRGGRHSFSGPLAADP